MFLDDVDLRLMEALFRNGRASNKSLARHVGLSESACHLRLRGLISARLISFRSDLAFHSLGAFQAWLDIELTDDRPSTLAAMEAAASMEPEIGAAHTMASSFQLRLLAVTAGYDACQALVQRLLERSDLVRSVRIAPIYKIGGPSPSFPRVILRDLAQRLNEIAE